jgi:hypothetical protein
MSNIIFESKWISFTAKNLISWTKSTLPCDKGINKDGNSGDTNDGPQREVEIPNRSVLAPHHQHLDKGILQHCSVFRHNVNEHPLGASFGFVSPSCII